VQGDIGPVVTWQLSGQTPDVNRYVYYDTGSLELIDSSFVALSVFGDGSENLLGGYFYDSQNNWVHFPLTGNEGMYWKGWRQIVFGLDAYDSTSGDFDRSDVAMITLEYSQMRGHSASGEIAFTPYAFYRFENSVSSFAWSRLGPFSLSSDSANFTLSTSGSLSLKSLMVTDVDNVERISELVFSASWLPNVTERGQTEFLVPLEADDCNLLVFKQSYHPLWLASLDNHELQHVAVNFGLNGFIIDGKTQNSVVVWFEGDKLLATGIFLSAFSLVVVVALVLTIRIRRRMKFESMSKGLSRMKALELNS